MTNLSGILQALPTILLVVVGPVVALILVLVRARGRIRTIGAVGAVLLVISGLGGGLLSLFLPLLIRRFELPISAAGLVLVPTNMIGWVGTVLLGVAVVIRVRAGAPVPRSAEVRR